MAIKEYCLCPLDILHQPNKYVSFNTTTIISLVSNTFVQNRYFSCHGISACVIVQARQWSACVQLADHSDPNSVQVNNRFYAQFDMTHKITTESCKTLST